MIAGFVISCLHNIFQAIDQLVQFFFYRIYFVARNQFAEIKILNVVDERIKQFFVDNHFIFTVYRAPVLKNLSAHFKQFVVYGIFYIRS